MQFAPIDDPEARALVAEAARLEQAHRQAELRLGEIKERLRDMAGDVRAARPADRRREAVEFSSDAGVCVVVFVSDAASLAKGADPLAVMRRFKGLDWTSVFRTKVVLARGFADALDGFPKPAQKAANNLIEWAPSEQRVILPKLG